MGTQCEPQIHKFCGEGTKLSDDGTECVATSAAAPPPSPCAGGGSDCSVLTKNKKCKKAEGCVWDKSTKTCAADEPEDLCTPLSTKKQCKKATGCVWSKKTCTAD